MTTQEDNITGTWHHRKITPKEDDKWQTRKMTSQENEITGRWHHMKMRSKEDTITWKWDNRMMTSDKDDITGKIITERPQHSHIPFPFIRRNTSKQECQK